MKILIFTPTYRLEIPTIESIFGLDTSGHNVDVMFSRFNPSKVPAYNRLFHYRRARDIVINNGYDYLLTIESDMIVRSDALKLLLDAESDIAVGLYVHRHGTNPASFQEFDRDFPHRMKDAIPWDKIDWENNQRLSGGGFGCALIKRYVLENIQLRLVIPKGVILADCDTWFYHDAIHNDYKIIGVPKVTAGHIDENGDILWPTPSGPIVETSRSPYIPSPYNLPESNNG